MPGFDRTGPRGEGPMTGGGRGLCVTPQTRGRICVSDYGIGRGGRPYGGGRGRAVGGGYGFRRQCYWDDPAGLPEYPAPVDPESRDIADVIGGILDRLNKLGETVAALYDRFEAGSAKAEGKEDQA